MIEFLKSLFSREPLPEHWTVDGGVLAPYAGMTDSDLIDYEDCFDVKPRTFPR